MKLSQMNTDQLARAMVELAGPIERIAADEEFNRRLESFAQDSRKRNKLRSMAEMYSTLAPLIDRHKEDAYAIIAVLTGKSAEEIARQNGLLTIREAIQCVDSELIGFFS